MKNFKILFAFAFLMSISTILRAQEDHTLDFYENNNGTGTLATGIYDNVGTWVRSINTPAGLFRNDMARSITLP